MSLSINTRSKVKTRNVGSKEFITREKLGRGDVLSRLLFIILITR